MTPRRRETLILGAAGLAAAAAGFLVGPAFIQQGGHREGDSLLSAGFPDLDARTRRLSEWRGKVLVCNFWATWCAPCREEIPMLITMKEKYGLKGVEIVGIAIDNAAKVREFSGNYKISYPVLLGEAGGLELMRQLGNIGGGLPYTVIINGQGDLVQRKLGLLKQADLEGLLDSLVKG